MDHLPQFMSHHGMLCLGFAAVLVAIFFVEAKTMGVGSAYRLSPQAVTQAMNHDAAVVIDIRDAAVFREGHILGAINVPVLDWEVQQKKIEKYQSKPVVIVDAMGQKAQTYRMKLVKSGFSNVSVLSGGMSAWRSANMPLTKGVK